MSRYRLPQAMMLTPASLAAPLLLVLKPGRREYRGGMPKDLEEWFRDLEQLAVTPRAPAVLTPVTWITANEAASMLRLSIRQTTAMASKMGGRKIGGRWMLDAASVAEEAEARSAAVGGRETADVA